MAVAHSTWMAVLSFVILLSHQISALSRGLLQNQNYILTGQFFPASFTSFWLFPYKAKEQVNSVQSVGKIDQSDRLVTSRYNCRHCPKKSLCFLPSPFPLGVKAFFFFFPAYYLSNIVKALFMGSLQNSFGCSR